MLIFLAGLEQTEPKHVGILKSRVPNAFYSYYYMRKDKTDKKITGVKKYHDIVFVDSGAHTFFSEDDKLGAAGVHKKKTKTVESHQEYFDNYVIWLKRNYEHYDYFAELDIGDIIGQKKVNEWREILKKENLYSKCVTVYHPDCMSWEDYINMLEDSQSKYVALEGDRRHRKRLPYIKLIKECYKRNIKVHGFAMTKDNVMSKLPFYSVDSTSWKSGEMYGAIPYFNGTKIQNAHVKKLKDAAKAGCRFNLDLLHHENMTENRLYRLIAGINAYKEAQIYYTKLWKKRGINWKV